MKEEKKQMFSKKLNVLEAFEPSPVVEEPTDQIDFDEDEDSAPKPEF